MTERTTEHGERRLAPTGDYAPGDSGFVDRTQDTAVTTGSDRHGAIVEAISNALMEDPALDASAIKIAVENGIVILTGMVTDAAERSRAEDCASRTTGVTQVQNRLQTRISGEGSVMTQA
ncbi:BON domain-containing protein [Rhizobium wuzhouense]|nr:BON domain-containing protein [Rhizobium wuzhouense]